MGLPSMTSNIVPPPVLRAPPFPWADASVSFTVAQSAAPPDPFDLFALVREARVGGRFWSAKAQQSSAGRHIVKLRGEDDVAIYRNALPHTGPKGPIWVTPSFALQRLPSDGHLCLGDVDPWSVLPDAQALVAHGDDEWIALARVLRVPVTVISSGRFGAPGDDEGALDRLAASALVAAEWRDPFTSAPSDIGRTIALLGLWRTILEANRPIVAACGMAWWKRSEISRFLWHPGRKLPIVRSPARALRIATRVGSSKGGAVAIWPSRASPSLISRARDEDVPLVRVEDGFVRSVGLGADLVPPSSVVVDASGIHFDPSKPSDLEVILNEAPMLPQLLERAKALREAIVTAGISKYTADPVSTVPDRQAGRKLILVPAQVEDDMSVLAGGGGITSNLELLCRVRSLEPRAEIWFRPHPDVEAGHRKGAVPDAEVELYADRIVRGGGMAPLLEAVDDVHVLTSLTGFEALMRGRQVTCHGTPFYAGWGLTHDLGEIPERRTRVLTLDALVAGVLILYPRYLDPVTGLPCPPEVLVSRMAHAGTQHAGTINRLSWLTPLRRWQGRLMNLLR